MIENLEFQVTNKCNLGCYYCANNPNANVSHELLQVDYVKKCIEKVSPKTVLFTGGEPTLEWDRLVECLKYTKSKKIYTILGSNLSILSKEQIDSLIDDYNIACFHTSFNDLDVEMSKNIRNTNETEREKIIENIHYIAQVKQFPIKVETILLKETIHRFSEINQFLYKLGVKHHKIEFLIPLGHATWKDLPNENEVEDAILKTYNEKASDCILELTCCYYTPCMNKFSRIFSITDDTFIMHKCIDGRRTFYIMANGDLTPCYIYFCNNLPNIKDNSLTELIYNDEKIKKIGNETNTKCQFCKYWRSPGNISCDNGCWALMLSETGSLHNICGEYVSSKLKCEQENRKIIA